MSQKLFLLQKKTNFFLLNSIRARILLEEYNSIPSQISHIHKKKYLNLN